MKAVKIGALSFLDYMMSTPKGCAKIVKAQRSMYTNPADQGFYGYESIKAALKRALSAVDGHATLDRAIADAIPTMKSHYEAVAVGFMAWCKKVKGTGIRAKDAVWTSGYLTVTLRHMIGLREADGSQFVVLTYVKDLELTQDMADLLLRILELKMPDILPGATPIVLDARRGKQFKLRKNANRNDLDAVLAAEAMKYVTHWMAAA